MSPTTDLSLAKNETGIAIAPPLSAPKATELQAHLGDAWTVTTTTGGKTQVTGEVDNDLCLAIAHFCEGNIEPLSSYMSGKTSS